VDALADDRVAGFGEVDADLVRAPGLELASDERCSREGAKGLDVGDGKLALLAEARGAAQSVAPILDEVAAKRLLFDASVREREVAPVHGPRAQLRREDLLRGERPRKNDEPTRLLVEALHDAERRRRTLAARPGQQRRHELVERAAFAGVVRNGADARR